MTVRMTWFLWVTVRTTWLLWVTVRTTWFLWVTVRHPFLSSRRSCSVSTSAAAAFSVREFSSFDGSHGLGWSMVTAVCVSAPSQGMLLLQYLYYTVWEYRLYSPMTSVSLGVHTDTADMAEVGDSEDSTKKCTIYSLHGSLQTSVDTYSIIKSFIDTEDSAIPNIG